MTDFPEFSSAGKIWRDLQDHVRDLEEVNDAFSDRIRALEEANDLLLEYIEADLSAPWEGPARRLAAKLRDGKSRRGEGLP